MGLLAFGIFCILVCAIAWVITYFLPQVGAPAIVPKIIWALAVVIILVVLAGAVGFRDVPIPRLR